MNDRTLDYLMRRVEDKRRMRDGEYNEDRYSRDRRDMRDNAYDSRGHYNHGNVDFEGSMDFKNSHERYREDYRGYRDYRDYRDYRRDGKEPLRLTKSDIRRWEAMLENTDGSHGSYYDMAAVEKIADKLGIRFEDYSIREFCMAVNMMYADYGHLLKHHAESSDDVLAMCAKMAKAFLEDPDGPEPSEKLALYFHCIVDSE